MLRAIPLVLLMAAAVPAGAQDESSALAGTVDGAIYTSPTGAFKMEIPVLPALGGAVHDTSTVVTFRDSFGLQISVGAFVHDATQRWELSTRGSKDYMIYFFGTYVLPDFRRFCPGTRIESAGYSVDLLDGALFTYILMPGGSVFATKPLFTDAAEPPVAKRGNLIFVKNGYTFVISTELSERVTEGSRYNKTVAEEDQLLRNRLVDVVKKMEFTKPAAAKDPASTQPAPNTP
jgi:hypothetical protein